MDIGTRKRKAYTTTLKLEACEYAEKSSNEKNPLNICTIRGKMFNDKMALLFNIIEAGSPIGGRGKMFY